MLAKKEPKSTWTNPDPLFFLGLFFVIIFLVTICVLITLLFPRPGPPSPVPLTDTPGIQIMTPPVVVLPTLIFSYLPIVPAAVAPAAQPIWKVTKVESQAHEVGGELFDRATFIRTDTQTVVQGYCIDRGLAVPEVGAEYLMTEGNILVPLQLPGADPIQRFQTIQ